MSVEVGQVYRKKVAAVSGRTKPENRGKHTTVRVGRVADSIASLRVIDGPVLFTRRVHVSVLLAEFELVPDADR